VSQPELVYDLIDVDIPDPSFDAQEVYRHKTLSRYRKSQVDDKGKWKLGSQFAPIPRRCVPVKSEGRNKGSLIASVMTDPQSAFRWKVIDIAEGRITRKVPGVTCEKIGEFKYKLSGSITGIAKLTGFGRMTVRRMLQALEQKCILRRTEVVHHKHTGSVYLFDDYPTIIEAWKRGGYGDTTDTEKRIGVDPGLWPWHNGRNNSKKLLSQRAIEDWHIADLFQPAATPAKTQPARKAPAPVTPPAAAPEPTAVPGSIVEVILTGAPSAGASDQLAIYKDAIRAGEELKTTLTEEEIAEAIIDIVRKIRHRRDIISHVGYIRDCLPEKVKAVIGNREARSRQDKADAEKKFRRQIDDCLRIVCHLIEPVTEEERQLLSRVQFDLEAYRKESPQIVAEIEALWQHDIERERSRPKRKPTPPPPDGVDVFHELAHEDDSPPEHGGYCPECRQYRVFKDGCMSTQCLMQRAAEAKNTKTRTAGS